MTTYFDPWTDLCARLEEEQMRRTAEECPVCHGSGEERWNPSRTGDPQCVESAPCRRCDGQGFLDPDAEREAYEERRLDAYLEDRYLERNGITRVL